MGYSREVSQVLGIDYSADDLWAIAQHYGFPTNFLDLTTDPIVAAMFACPPTGVLGSGNATILLYTEQMIDSWNDPKAASGSEIELLRVDVSNLWRLQAQRGLFLYNPFSNLCDYHMPDRIVFPRASKGFVHPDYELYPKDKSMLELQLDPFL
jgi:hypothetical protein